jgi:hypothetical protein
METVNSLSGGKTSSYMAIHYPADYELFSLVCVDDSGCGYPDKKVMQLVNDKLQKYCPQFGETVGTAEHYKTIKVMLDLEQKVGREIIWLRGESFDNLIEYKKALPNQESRWCTHLLKIDPIFWFTYLHTKLPIDIRIGYRYDEMERAERLTTDYKFTKSSKYYGKHYQNWETMEWRTTSTPLIEDKIIHPRIIKYWSKQEFDFPPDSNCQMCFWKDEMQLRKNFEDSPKIMEWAERKEKETGNRFKHSMLLSTIKKIGLQTDFFYGTGAGCNAGECSS